MEVFKDSKPSARTDMEAVHSKKAVKDFVFKIEQSNDQVHARKAEQSLRNTLYEEEDPCHAELMQRLGCLKQELSRLKLDVSSAVESKARAEKDIEFYSLRTISSLNKMEELMKEIEEANEEHVVVELARIEAERELREIESRRAAEAMEFSKNMEAAKKRIRELRREIGASKQVEEKLASTNTDISVLQNEMELVRAMKKKNSEEEEEELRIAEYELMKAKRKLVSIKDEGFQFMRSMDKIREELLLVSNETNRTQKLEKSLESAIGFLNSKLLKEKSKLKSATSMEERARVIVTNLGSALQQLQIEVETAEEEGDRAIRETSEVKQEVEKTGMYIKSKEKKLQDAVTKLGTVKASEFSALVKLKGAMENTVKNRALASQNSAMICVSNWEYEYLISRGESAQEVADKKVAAFDSWIEAVRAHEKEMLLKSELIEKEIKAVRDEEEKVSAQKTMEEEANEFTDMLNAGVSTPLKAIGENSLSAGRRSSKVRRTSAMAGIRGAARSPSFTIKKKKKVMPNLGAILRARGGRKKRTEVDIGSYSNLLLPPENDKSRF